MKHAIRMPGELERLVLRCPTTEPFTTAAAATYGLSPDQLSELVGACVLRRPLRGVYVHAAVADSLSLRAAVLRLVVPEGAFVSDRTAGWLHGATTALAPGDHLVVPALDVFRIPTRTRLRNTLVTGGRRTVAPDDLCVIDGLVATTPLRTCLDLGRLQRRDLAMAGMDALAALDLVDPAEVMASVPRFRGARGVVQLRELAPLVDGGAQSAAESALRLRWHDAGLPRAVCQAAVTRPGRCHYFVDLGLPDERFGAEYDGEAFHGPEHAEHDARRRRWLRESADWRIEVFRTAHVFGVDQDATERLAQAWRAHRRSRATVPAPRC